MFMALYNGLLFAASPLIRCHMDGRLARGKEDAARIGERYGTASLSRPEGELVWIHAASVGEAVSALTLVDRLIAGSPARHILVTTGTRTSANIMQARLPAAACHQFIPIDRKLAVVRFLDHWRPDIAIWMESEIWPNLITETSARRIPMMMVNARIAEKSYNLWRKSLGFSRQLLGRFDYCTAQSEASAQRLRALGADPVEYLGNLKFSADPLPVDAQVLAGMEQQMAGRPLWLAASTHDGEEAVVADAHARLQQTFPDLLTIIVPRHPDRGNEVAAMLAVRGLDVATRSRGDVITAKTEIYLADTIGELGLFYRLARIVCVGGSFADKGGQNPIEAARLGCVILHGPHMENFADVITAFEENAATEEVADAVELARAVSTYFADDPRAELMVNNAAAVVTRGQETLDKTVARIEGFLNGGGRENA